VTAVQATVHEFDGTTGGGSVLLDDGRRLPLAPDAFSASGRRLLRVGQRLTVETDGDRVVTALRIVGI
jgi:2-phospho-L-lactate guanylyltransferase